MVGVDVFVSNILLGVGMLWLGGLIFGSFSAPFVGLRAFILEPHFQAGFECFLGRPT